jgi:hypothetical protein
MDLTDKLQINTPPPHHHFRLIADVKSLAQRNISEVRVYQYLVLKYKCTNHKHVDHGGPAV